MKRIIIRNDGRYTHHGIGWTEHDGYGGTADNRMTLQMAQTIELRNIRVGEQYQLEVNGETKGIYTKQATCNCWYPAKGYEQHSTACPARR